MPSRSTLLCAAALALPLAMLAAPSGALAAQAPVSRLVLHDPTGDVWTIPSTEDEPPVSAGDVPTADVVRAVVRHGRYRVVVKMTFTDLRRVDSQSYSATLASRGWFGGLFVSTGPGVWRGHHILVDEEFAKVKCPKLTHSIDYGTEQVTFAVPRTCIGRPNWVKVGLTNYMFRADSEDVHEITDNPHSTGAEGSLSQRLYRAGS